MIESIRSWKWGGGWAFQNLKLQTAMGCPKNVQILIKKMLTGIEHSARFGMHTNGQGNLTVCKHDTKNTNTQ